MSYRFIQDASHGWLEVPLQELVDLKIASKISPFSYAHNGYAYLEEDCDAAIFVNAREAKGLRTPFTVERQDPTPIRTYPDFDRKAYQHLTH